jgi:hypothetical protein
VRSNALEELEFGARQEIAQFHRWVMVLYFDAVVFEQVENRIGVKGGNALN